MTATTIDTALLNNAELVAALREEKLIQQQSRSRELAVIAALQHNGFAHDHGYPSVQSAVAAILRVHRKTANELVRHTELVGPRHTMTGQPLEPRLPATAEALAEGAVNMDQFAIITSAVTSLGNRAGVDQVETLEALLVEQAATLGPDALKHRAIEEAAKLDQDGPEPNDTPLQSGNRLHLLPTMDGGATLKGNLDPASYATIKALIDSLNEPIPGPNGERDERTKAHRDGDALIEAAHRLLTHGKLPQRGGERPHITLTIDLETLETQLGQATLDTGGRLTPAETRMLACDAKILPVIMRGKSIADIATPKYRVPPALRKAITTRDQHCAFPGCRIPPQWCDAHHLKSWITQHGETAQHNLTLLCRSHHRLVHASNWTIHMINDQPWFTPPWFIDPQRKPLLNPL